MEKLLVKGGNKLKGEVTISGAKNAAVAILPACLLVKGNCRIENLPDIKDVKLFLRILEQLNADVKYIDKNTVDIDCTNVDSYRPLGDLTRKMRGSSYLMGALLGRFSNFIVDPPGGCDFGTRPIDQHIKAFETLGADIDTSKGVIEGSAENLSGGNIFFDVITVGATINAMLAATTANGVTVIENAAKEPHIVDLANFLNNMGANIRGAGTDTIKIKGTKDLHGGTYTIIPDQIEAGTFMIAAAATRGDVVLKNVIPRHLEIISAKLIEAGVNISEGEDSVRVWVNDDTKFKHINFIAMPYPGFPTDMQPQLVTFLTTIEGTSMDIGNIADENIKIITEDTDFEIGNIGIRPFAIPHDATQPVGFNFMIGDEKYSLATDIGKITKSILEKITGSKKILLESNHDVEMLKCGTYPYPLKRRILGEYGHLSNETASKVALHLVQNGTEHIMLGHLSKENNRPEIAMLETYNLLSQSGVDVGKDMTLQVADRYKPTLF